jgi:hypothetical protein
MGTGIGIDGHPCKVKTRSGAAPISREKREQICKNCSRLFKVQQLYLSPSLLMQCFQRSLFYAKTAQDAYRPGLLHKKCWNVHNLFPESLWFSNTTFPRRSRTGWNNASSQNQPVTATLPALVHYPN